MLAIEETSRDKAFACIIRNYQNQRPLRLFNCHELVPILLQIVRCTSMLPTDGSALITSEVSPSS